MVYCGVCENDFGVNYLYEFTVKKLLYDAKLYPAPREGTSNHTMSLFLDNINVEEW